MWGELASLQGGLFVAFYALVFGLFHGLSQGLGVLGLARALPPRDVPAGTGSDPTDPYLYAVLDQMREEAGNEVGALVTTAVRSLRAQGLVHVSFQNARDCANLCSSGPAAREGAHPLELGLLRVIADNEPVALHTVKRLAHGAFEAYREQALSVLACQGFIQSPRVVNEAVARACARYTFWRNMLFSALFASGLYALISNGMAHRPILMQAACLVATPLLARRLSRPPGHGLWAGMSASGQSLLARQRNAYQWLRLGLEAGAVQAPPQQLAMGMALYGVMLMAKSPLFADFKALYSLPAHRASVLLPDGMRTGRADDDAPYSSYGTSCNSADTSAYDGFSSADYSSSCDYTVSSDASSYCDTGSGGDSGSGGCD